MTILLAILLAIPSLLLAAVLLACLFTAWTARKVETLLPPRGRCVDAAGMRLHVREFDGPPGAPTLLLVHGLGGQTGHFTYAVTDLLAGRYRIVAVDRPGNGHSSAGSADLADQAAALASVIVQLGLERPLVVGHSLGGAVALALALDHPQHVAGLALLAPLTHMQDAVPPVFKSLTIESRPLRTLLAWTFAIPASIRNSRTTLDQVFGPDAVPKDYAMRGAGLLGLRPKTFLAASADIQALPARLPAQQARYGSLRLPLRVLYGREDRILDWRAHGQALVDAVPGARLELIDGGHMLPVTHARACADLVDDVATAVVAAAVAEGGPALVRGGA
jgi:pimeloyl-ACP methyl ester carboxylesterase